jgi:hypothetical protein
MMRNKTAISNSNSNSNRNRLQIKNYQLCSYAVTNYEGEKDEG